MSVAPRQLLLYVALPFAAVAGTALAAPVATVGEIENPGVIANCSIVAEPNSAYVTPAVTFTSRQTTESIVSFSFYDDKDTLVASDDVTVPVPPVAGVIPPLPRFGQPARFRSLRCAVKVAVVSGSSRSDVPAPADTPSAIVTMPAAPLLPTPIPTSTPVPAPPTTTPMPTITPTPTAVPTTTPRPTATPMPTVTPMPTITPTPKPPSLPVSAAPVITGCSIKQDAGSAESTPLITFQSPPLKPTLVRMSFYDAAGHFAGKQDVLVPLPPATGPTPPLPSFVLTIIYASLRCTEP